MPERPHWFDQALGDAWRRAAPESAPLTKIEIDIIRFELWFSQERTAAVAELRAERAQYEAFQEQLDAIGGWP
jgi:hypothetical protein